MATKVGFIGLGTMGKPMAANALQAGFDLMVYDLQDDPMRELAASGAKAAGSCREVGAHAEIIQLAVPDDAAVEAVLLGEDGALSAGQPGSVVAVHSTVHPRTIRRVAENAQARGVAVLDAQMTGAQRGAIARSLTFMVGGDAAVLERCRPVLEASGRNIFHMGGLGMGAVTKAAQQAMTCVNLLAAVEGFRLAERAGVDMEVFQRVVALSTAQSFVADTRMGFPTAEGARRDGGDPRPFYRGLRAVLALAYDLDVPLPATALAQQTIPWRLGADGDAVAGARGQPPGRLGAAANTVAGARGKPPGRRPRP